MLGCIYSGPQAPSSPRVPIAKRIKGHDDKEGRRMHCHVGRRLFLEYRTAVRDWMNSIKELKYDHAQQLLERIEEDRLSAMRARDLYLEHVAEHGCAKWTGKPE